MLNARFIRQIAAAFAVAVLVGLTGASCGSAVKEGRGSGFLVIDLLEGASGAEDDEFATELSSDVLTNGGVIEDIGRVRMRLVPKDVTQPLSTNNDVTVTRYRVSFRRSDGRNRQGVDVPYTFDGGVTFTIGEQPVEATFVIVRVQAKVESPLIELRGGGGALAISTLADVTFYGKDQTGRDVTVTGTISVNFADWVDPED
ncbi:MAG: hypothetical protein KJ061_06630 [Vicinamibacteraceae bacterium]|nr:hypothetical protein [Vicinamibacteraceae bacterium]